MAEEGNRRAPVRLADGTSPGGNRETRKLKREKDLKGRGATASQGSGGIGTNVAIPRR